ncbi:MAG: ABC transporter permease subunit [Planctomycetaceae bacterium]|nr:ABC transporter permease subunit [Planctomycetaceae bacterium]
MSTPSPARADSLARVGRLTLKELRETLRDRRTIVTLVLMPLLVYPLLSLGFKQLLAASTTKTDPGVWRIGTESDSEGSRLWSLLLLGDAAFREQSAPVADQSSQSSDLALQNPYTVSGGSVEEAVLRGDIDLGVRASRREGAPTPNFTDFELVYAADSSAGPAAAAFVIERLRAANDRYAVERLRQLGDRGALPARWKSQPIGEVQGTHFQLATLVPMVLILMTITGAVYPAIDLTAGERERGTLEALMAAPVPRLGLLFAKYIAVLTVALLTALVNIVGMVVTVLGSGLGSVLFGEHGLTLGSVVLVFLLLVLFAAFFSAVLLCVTSFARSFKEAQAYLIPLMLVALAPGFMTILPGIQLNAWLSVAPLANIVLLARDTLQGQAHPLWGLIAVLSTALYGTAALGLAARIFGSDSILYGSQSSWSDLFRRPAEPLAQPTLAGAMSCLALVVPLFVIASGSLAQLANQSMAVQLLASAAMLVVLFGAVPILVARWQGISLPAGFQLRRAPLLGYVGSIILGLALAPLAYELIVISQMLGIATISQQELEDKAPLVQRLVAQWRALPPALVLAAVALVPAIVEELFFRGYFLGALRGRLPAWLAIAFSALVFGLFHASVGGLIAVERIFSSMALGVALGWVAWTTRSVIPGMFIHAVNNAFVVSLAYWGDGLRSLGIDVEGRRHLPLEWIAGAVVGAAVGASLVYLGRPVAASPPLPASPLAVETPPP